MTVIKVKKQEKNNFPDLFQVLIDVVTGDGGVYDELKQLTHSHRWHLMLQKEVYEKYTC